MLKIITRVAFDKIRLNSTMNTILSMFNQEVRIILICVTQVYVIIATQLGNQRKGRLNKIVTRILLRVDASLRVLYRTRSIDDEGHLALIDIVHY